MSAKVISFPIGRRRREVEPNPCPDCGRSMEWAGKRNGGWLCVPCVLEDDDLDAEDDRR